MAFVLIKGELTSVEVAEQKIAAGEISREDVYGKPVPAEPKLKPTIFSKKAAPKA